MQITIESERENEKNVIAKTYSWINIGQIVVKWWHNMTCNKVNT